MKNIHAEKSRLNIAVSGLGSGSCACLANHDDNLTFYEINPDMVKTASNSKYFSFLQLCPPKGGIIMGDARLNLKNAKDHSFDVMILDAFSSDSIPVHLLTTQAMEMYLDKLKDNGVMMINISNRYIDLRKVISALAARYELSGMFLINDKDDSKFIYSSIWVVLAKKNVDIFKITEGSIRMLLPEGDVANLWTDDYSNIVRLMR
jgi:spermidine synthase